MVTHARRHRQRRHQHQHRQLHRLRDRAVGREQPRSMEPTQHRGTGTTNHLEGWHHKLKSYVQHPHPNIYNLIKLIQSQQSATEIRLIQYAAGGKRIQRKRKYIQIDNRLATLKERLNNGAITLEEFADSASHVLHLG